MECLHIAVAVQTAEEEGGGEVGGLTQQGLHAVQGGAHSVYLLLQGRQELLLLLLLPLLTRDVLDSLGRCLEHLVGLMSQLVELNQTLLNDVWVCHLL